MTDDTTDKQRTNREVSNANLIPIKPGECLNPGGRPKGKSITAELRKLLDDGTVAEDIAKALIRLARDTSFKGNVAALRELLDRTDGKVADVHKIEGDVPISIVYQSKKDEDATKQEEG